MFSHFEKSLLRLAICVKILIWILSFVSDELIEDHDYSSHLILTKSPTLELSLVGRLFKCFLRWDAVIFMDLAQNGYLYLKNHAFFPFFSFFSRAGAEYFFKPLKIFTEVEAILLSGLGINFVVGVLNIYLFYKMSSAFLEDEEMSKRAAIFYLISPAGIFFSAFYVEPLFGFFTLLGLWLLYDESKGSFEYRCLYTAVLFFLASLVRSNGNLYTMVIGYEILKKLIYSLRNFRFWRIENLKMVILGIIVALINNLAYFMVMKAPYTNYCLNLKEDHLMKKPEFCQKFLPNAYAHIQDKYWNVGFLHSYIPFSPNKIIFILMGLPMVIYMAIILYKYLSKNFLNTMFAGIPYMFLPGKRKIYDEDPFLNAKMVPHILITIVMFVVNTFFAHINVMTRLNSFNPVIYWYAAYALRQREESKKEKVVKFSFRNYPYLYFSVISIILGCTVFSNFYLFV